jgi:U4/U6.U5 tri-snRNP component SNU23
MADKKTAGAGDTDFRRTWDKAEYAERARVNEAKQKEESKARYEAKLAGKRYVRRASTPPDVRETQARSSRLNIGDMVGKTMLVPAGASIGKRGRGAGFYCEACDLTFKDNLQLVEHYNSKQHLQNTGESWRVAVATVEEVRERLRWLKRKQIEERRENEVGVDLEGRLDRAKEKEDAERERKRRKRNEQRRRKAKGNESD